jgi:hypothetical protein
MKIPTIGLRIARAPGVGGSLQSSGPTRLGPRSGQFRSAIGPHSRPIGTAESHATGRQRSDGSRPVGNSSGRNVSSTGKPPAHTQVVSQAAKAPPGTEPGAVHRAYTANSLAKVTSPWDSPMVQKIQPSRCRGRRTATTAPTRENPRTRVTAADRSTSSRGERWFLAAKTTAELARARQTRHRRRASHAVARHRVWVRAASV